MKNIKTYEEYKAPRITFKEYLDENDIDPDIKNFYCDNGDLVDLNGIEQFKDLETLDCYVNHITSLKGIENLTKLTGLYAHTNQITSLTPLKNLKNLTVLQVSVNKITSLKPILNLTNLIQLFCDGNPINWVDYVDKKGNTWYIELPKSIKWLDSDKFINIKEYWAFMEENQPALVSRKFNF